MLIGVGWWVRLSLGESPVFEAARAEAGAHKAPVAEVLKARPWQVLIGGGLKIGENVSFYLMTTFGITYLTEVMHLSRSATLNSILAGSVVATVTMPLWSALSDRIGRRPVYAFGALGVGLWAFAYYPLLTTRQPLLITAALVIGLAMHSAMNGPQGAMIAELFPTRIRYSGASLAYQVTPIVGGSWAPVISLAIFKAAHNTAAISVYLAASCAISFACALAARETKGLSWREIDAAA